MKDNSSCRGFSLPLLWMWELLLVFAVIQSLRLSPVESVPVSANFTSLTKLCNLAINPVNGIIYVGAVNRLYQMDNNLENKIEVVTGPLSEKRTATDINNSNQILEVDLNHNQLIACGTVYHGTCERRNLSDITAYVDGNGKNYTFIGSNDPNFPMVGIVAPGPSEDSILYVGTSSTGKTTAEYLATQCKSGVCSLSTAGSNPFEVLIEQARNARQSAELEQSFALQHNRSYVAAFNVSGYNYFLTRQSEYRLGSKIAQVCQRDQWYDSYVETWIVCNSSEVDFNLIVAGVFVQPGAYWANILGISASDYIFLGVFSSSSSPSSSGVCIYQLKDIRRTFTRNIQRCDEGNTNVSVSDGFVPRKKCTLQQRTVTDTFCGTSAKANSPLNGTIPLLSNSLLNLNLNGITVTAIAATAINDYTVLFLGTSNGQLLEFVMSGSNGLQYGSVRFEGDVSPVNKDLVFNEIMTHIYVMTSFRLYKVALYECEKYLTCNDCLSAKDPFCGWCTLERRCTTKQECRNSSLPQRWNLPISIGSTDVCPSLRASPLQAGVRTPTPVTLSFSGLPPVSNGEYYSCIFGPGGVSSRANYITNQLTCTSPNDYAISSVVRNLSIQLDVQISSLNISFISTPFTIYNCSSYTVCSQCVQAKWGCHWCINTGQCQQGATPCSFPVNTNSAERCPSVSPDGREILIPSGSQQKLSVQILNLQSLQDAGVSNFQCRLNFTPLKMLRASIYNSTFVECETSSYQYHSDAISVPLEIVWGSNSYPVEGKYVVTVFSCSSISGGDCSICLSLQSGDHSKYGCYWCSDTCRTKYSSDSCTTREQTCPSGIINSIYPSRVPVDGGSLVTISGTNLGYNFTRVRVEVDGTKVEGVESEYETSTRYVFNTSRVSHPGQAVVKVTIDGDVSRKILKNITFTNPELFGITPSKGPEAGGTMVTITGKDLDSGSKITVLFGSTECKYQSSNNTHIICETTSANAAEVTTSTSVPSSSGLSDSGTVVRFDNAVRILNKPFKFTENPSKEMVMPGGSFQSGGCTITVKGYNLDIAYSSAVKIGGAPATIIARNATHLLFLSPKWNNSWTTPTNATAEIKLDAVTVNFNFIIHPDPYFNRTKSGETYNTGSTLHLMGERLDTPCLDREIVVKIGSQICPITSKDKGNVFCTVPDLSSRDVPTVTVSAGRNLEFHLGQLNLFSAPLQWPIAVGVIGGASLLIIIIIVIIFVVKRIESKRRIKKLSQQLEVLEKNVRTECRLAFLALQTEVLDFNTDLENIGIPFLDYKMYTFKLLFPTAGNHPILYPNRNLKNSFGGFDEQMHQFNQLLSSKFFILAFIQVLDKQQKAFSMQDRTKVSSLLSVILLNRMEFATDIVKELLEDLINRSIEKKNPKLMLRSTESLVEKLLANWLSLSMYEYLCNNSAGRALFMLFKALKHQTEKGAIDAVTAEAKNTLSEDRLLREKVEPTTLTVTVHEGYNCIPCKMLSCDTVSQAKGKALDAVFRNTPYSRRLSVIDINLGWRTGIDSVQILADEDQNTRVDHGWTRINTLEHYQIQDGASLVILQKPKQEESIEKVDEYLSQNFGYSLNPTTDNRRIWHLVKHEDSQSAKGSKVISEIFLTRLLTTKMIIEPYVSELFAAIFKVDDSLPPVVKYLFDFLDRAAQTRGIVEDDVVHTWKSNSLLLRFWVNVITNPSFVFDVCKSDIVSCCLSVVAQAFMDSCSTQELNIGQDSPSTKLLFAKDIPKYRNLAKQFFARVRNLPPVSDADMDAKMMEMSTRNRTDFNLEVALRDLYVYADKFKYELMVALGNNASCKRMHLLEKFQDVLKVMNGEQE